MKNKKLKSNFVLIVLVIFFCSCNDFQKILNSKDNNLKYKAAETYYNNGEYRRANRLLEQIMPSYRGKPQSERIIFFYADSYLKTKNYYLAAYQFENFINSYPKSQKLEEAYFLEAKCYYFLSPQFSLDQDDTITSLEKLQIFINNYPNSKFMGEANVLVSELQTKLERKDYEISKQYYTIRDYKSALKSIDNFIANHPGTSFREGALYYKFLSAYEIAINSIINKQKERLEELVILHDNILRYYPETIYSEDLQKKIINVNNLLNNFKKT
tara:strand:- start:1196 stop:2008 length:813 start_codon:yes stop_codon:yes gene_type:complete